MHWTNVDKSTRIQVWVYIHRFPPKWQFWWKGFSITQQRIMMVTVKKIWRFSGNLFIDTCLKILRNWQSLPSIVMSCVVPYSVLLKLCSGSKITTHREIENLVLCVHYVSWMKRWTAVSWYNRVAVNIFVKLIKDITKRHVDWK